MNLMTKQNGFTKSVKKQHENLINLNKVGKLWANKKISNFKKNSESTDFTSDHGRITNI